MTKFTILIGLSVALWLTPASAAERAWYGFHIKPNTSGFPLNPVVTSVVIDKIKSNSPADAQNMHVGDEIIEAEGKTVPGARALQLISLLTKQPGDWLHLRLRRPDGASYAVLIQGIKKPD